MPPLIDYAGSLERMGGDERLFGEMAGFFLADAPKWLAEVRRGLDTGDAKLVHRSAHSLKGLASNFGAQQAVMAAARVEQLSAGTGDLAPALAAMPTLEQAISELAVALAPYDLSPKTAAG
jgi:HPt (histidine-containing phosphotransfer) domain-containing protein